MPIYEYECPGCRERFSLLRPMRNMDEPVRCPKCDGESARRVLSQFAAVTKGAACAPSG